MANCILIEGGIDITGLSLMEAHQIKIALIHFSKKIFPLIAKKET